MKLNSDILLGNLSSFTSVESFGPVISEFCLSRPQFVSGERFRSGSVTVSIAEQLPEQPEFEGKCLVICLGGMPSRLYLTGLCTCFVATEFHDLFGFFNRLQRIYNRYDDWDEQLQTILREEGGLQKIVDVSYSVFRNPLIIIDGEFRLRAYSDIINNMEELSFLGPDENGNLKQMNMRYRLHNQEKLTLSKKGFMNWVDEKTHLTIFSQNLFVQGIYAGNVTLPFSLSNCRPGDKDIFQYFFKIIEQAVNMQASLLQLNITMVNRILRQLLKEPEKSLDMAQRACLDEICERKEDYVCCVMRLGEKSLHSVSLKYLCNLLETSFPYSFTMEQDSMLVLLLNVDHYKKTSDILHQSLYQFAEEMDLTISVSCLFSDLYMFRSYYRQACCGFEYGSIIDKEKRVYLFEDYKLNYMLISCFGDFTPKMMCTKGVRLLLKHDESSQSSYIGTLRAYLNNNMNISQTASDLYIHRSTLLARLKRIEEMLALDLEIPRNRLYLQIILAALEMNEEAFHAEEMRLKSISSGE